MPLKCIPCNKIFINEDELHEHMEDVHAAELYTKEDHIRFEEGSVEEVRNDEVVVMLGYFIPGMGPRATTVGLCFIEEEGEAAINRAITYIDKTGFLCPIIETVPKDDFYEAPIVYITELSERAKKAYLEEYPDDLVQEEDTTDYGRE